MPLFSSTFNKKHPTLNFKSGFLLVEIVVSILFVLAIITVILSTASTFITSRGANLQSIATKIASRQIESLRKTDFASLPASGAFADSDLAKLPQGTAARTVSDYQSSSDIKLATIQISWITNGVGKTINMETLIYRYGL